MKSTITITFFTVGLTWLVLSMTILEDTLKIVGFCVSGTFLILAAMSKGNRKVK